MIDLFAPRGRYHTYPSVADRIDATGDCWVWTGATNTGGYGRICANGNDWYVHRLVWTALVGEIPDGLELDHLCQNKVCCNPDHLEPTTRKKNQNRNKAGMNAITRNQVEQTHCQYGHPFSGDNLLTYKAEGRTRKRCRACYNPQQKARAQQSRRNQ